MHVAIRGRKAAFAHHNGDLVQRFGQRSPEVPIILSAAHIGPRIALDRMVQIRKLQRIAQEKHRRVIADQIPIAFVSVELHRKAADIALRVRGAALAGHRSEARE